MKKIILVLLFSVLTFSVKSQVSIQNIQDVLNECGQISGSDIQMQYFHAIPQTKINNTADIVNAGYKGLFFLRIRATDFRGCINFYLQDAPILQINSARSLDTGEIYLICDSYDALGIQDDSGTITIEGYKYTPNSTQSKSIQK